MEKIMTWYDKIKPNVVTFDFDSTLTAPEYDGEYWIQSNMPNYHLIHKLIEEAKNNTIYIVTARSKSQAKDLFDFLESFDLMKYVKDVIFTGDLGGSKLDALRDLRSLRHYDDSQEHIEEAKALGIETVKVPHPMDEGDNLPPQENHIYKEWESNNRKMQDSMID